MCVLTAMVFWKRVRDNCKAREGKAGFSKGDRVELIRCSFMELLREDKVKISAIVIPTDAIFHQHSIVFSYFKWMFKYNLQFTFLMCNIYMPHAQEVHFSEESYIYFAY